MNKTKTTRCAIYTRVSTDNQAEKEFSSCESQEEKIRSFVASQNDWQIAKVYSDTGFTGANTNRPAFQELFNDIKLGQVDIILSYKIDRLTRSPKDFYQLIEFFEQNNVSFISITERFDTSTPAGRLLRNIMLTFSQFERELTSERTKDKLLERAKKGLCNGGLVPYGYMKENKKLISYSKETKEIKSIFERYIETKSLSKVYDFLKENNIRNRTGKNFSKTTIAHILRNVVYVGKVKYNGVVYDGIHEPIVSGEIFALAQKIHKNKLKNFRVYKNFLFGGLVKCKECDSTMTSHFTNKNRQGKLRRYYYYRCTSTMKQDWQVCPVKQVNAERLENYVLENLERISVDRDYIENLVFRMNNGLRTPLRAGCEPSQVCSKFSKFEPHCISSTLKFFLSSLQNKKGIEKNLLAKKFIQKILYSPENIKISLFSALCAENFGKEKSPAARSAAGQAARSAATKRELFSPNKKFVSPIRLRTLNEIRTFFKENPLADF